MIPYAAVWAQVHELLALSAELRQRSRAIHAESAWTHSRLEALYRHMKRLQS